MCLISGDCVLIFFSLLLCSLSTTVLYVSYLFYVYLSIYSKPFSISQIFSVLVHLFNFQQLFIIFLSIPRIFLYTFIYLFCKLHFSSFSVCIILCIYQSLSMHVSFLSLYTYRCFIIPPVCSFIVASVSSSIYLCVSIFLSPITHRSSSANLPLQ